MILWPRILVARARPRIGARAGRAAANGYAAIDALVALTILSTTMALAIGAGEVSRRVSLVAEETRRADGLARFLLATPSAQISEQRGTNGPFEWALTVAAAPGSAAPQGVQLCERRLLLISTRSRRAYRVATAAICPTEQQHAG